VKTRIIFWGGMAMGSVLLLWLLQAYGAPSLHLLQRRASPPGLLLFALAATATIGCLSLRWRYLLQGLSDPPPFLVLALQRSAGHSLAVLIPSGKLGGDPLRAWLATRRGVPGSDAIASVAVDRTLETISSAPFSVLFAFLLLQHGIPQLDRALITILIGTILLLVTVGVAARALRRGRGIVSEVVRRIASASEEQTSPRIKVIEASEAAAKTLIGQRSRLWFAFALGIVANFLVVFEFWALLSAFGLPHDGVALVAAIFATGAAHMLPIPAGVGALEGAQVWLFSVLGYPLEIGLAVGLAVRCRELVWMAPGLAYLLATTLYAAQGNSSKAESR